MTTSAAGEFVPLLNVSSVACPATLLNNVDVSGWETVCWSITAQSSHAPGADWIWLNDTWSFPGDADSSLLSDPNPPAAHHALLAEAGNSTRYATPPKAPLLTLTAASLASPPSPNLFDIRVWASSKRITNYDLSPQRMWLAEDQAVTASEVDSILVPSYEGPVICEAWSNATDPTSRVDLRNMGVDAFETFRRIGIVWKPTNTAYQSTIVLPPGANRLDLVNNDSGTTLWDVALTPLPY